MGPDEQAGTTNRAAAEATTRRIGRFVDIVGAERVIAGSDCGFGTFAGFGAVDPEIAWAKLKTLRDGADIAAAGA